MLTDAEYAADRRMTDADLAAIGPDAEAFTWFTWDLAAAVDSDGSPLFPELVETNSVGVVRPVHAWKVRKHTRHSLRAVLAAEAAEEEKKRQANLAKYIDRGFAFEQEGEG